MTNAGSVNATYRGVEMVSNAFNIQKDMIKDSRDHLEDMERRIGLMVAKGARRSSIDKVERYIAQLKEAYRSRRVKLKTEARRAESSDRDRKMFKHWNNH